MNRHSPYPAASPWPRRARVIAVITVVTAVALLAAACGGSSSSAGSGAAPNAGRSTASASAVAWIQCVRSHGVPDFPGPDSRGYIPKIASGQGVGVSDSRLNAARGACQALWPYQAPTQAQQHQQLADDLKFAQCMRSHGLPDFPDPTTDPKSGRVEFVLSVSRDGFNPHSPQILAKAHACERVLPAGTGLPSVTVTP